MNALPAGPSPWTECAKELPPITTELWSGVACSAIVIGLHKPDHSRNNPTVELFVSTQREDGTRGWACVYDCEVSHLHAPGDEDCYPDYWMPFVDPTKGAS